MKYFTILNLWNFQTLNDSYIVHINNRSVYCNKKYMHTWWNKIHNIEYSTFISFIFNNTRTRLMENLQTGSTIFKATSVLRLPWGWKQFSCELSRGTCNWFQNAFVGFRRLPVTRFNALRLKIFYFPQCPRNSTKSCHMQCRAWDWQLRRVQGILEIVQQPWRTRRTTQ